MKKIVFAMVSISDRKHKPPCRLAFLCLVLLSRVAIASNSPATTCHYDEILTMDVWTSYSPKYAIHDFQKFIKQKYKKNVGVYARKVLSPDEFYDRVRSESTDIISPSHNFLKDERTKFIANRLVLPLDRNLLPNLDQVEYRFIHNEFVTDNGKLYAVPLAAGGYSLFYDKRVFQKKPTSWNILWDPRFKKRYSISKDFYEANIYITALALGYPHQDISNIAKLNNPIFKSKLRYLLENANYWHGAPRDIDLKTSVLTTGWGLSNSISHSPKSPWKMAFTKEGVTFWTDYLAVTRRIDRSAFARLLAFEWLNYMIGETFQVKTIISDRHYLSPIKTFRIKRARARDYDASEVQFLNEKTLFWPLLSIRNRNGLRQLHEDVMKDIEANK